MRLKHLARGLPVQIKGDKEVQISGLCTHSQLATPGCLFIAKNGRQKEGRQFIDEAIGSGAHAVLTDLYNPFLAVSQLIHPYPAQLEAQLASQYYHFPSKQLLCIGVTGTNGKTTITWLLRHLLNQMQSPCGVIGTLHYATHARTYDAQHTTPEPAKIQKLLREMVESGCKCAAMEVSSHALDQGRARAVEFDGAIFANLSSDHLDYHLNLEQYAAVKERLFHQLNHSSKSHRFAIINADDPRAEQMKKATRVSAHTYSLQNAGDLNAQIRQCDLSGTQFDITWQGRSVPCSLPLIGRHNVYNALAALTCLLARGASLDQIVGRLATFAGVPGRLQRVKNAKKLAIFVDFAHTADALRSSLAALRAARPLSRLMLVFGCGGNRDTKKRPEMGAVAARGCDEAIITSDNPRDEEPMRICEEICAGWCSQNPYCIQVDRRLAICQAIARMKVSDILLIAGKGHEKTQTIGGKTLPFSDQEVVEWACS